MTQESLDQQDVAAAVACRAAAQEATASGEGPRARGRAQRTAAGSGRRGRKSKTSDGACPSLTHHQTRQMDVISQLSAPPVVAFDWWESSGCVEHGKRSNLLFEEIGRVQQSAEIHRREQPLHLGDGQILVFSRGMGAGRSARFENRLEWLGATIGLSTRHVSNRQLPNFYLKIPGETCVIHGAREIRQRVISFLADYDINLTDEWFRRLDICLDLPGCDFGQSFAPACEAKQYFGSGLRSAPYREGMATTGFSVKTGALELAIYDKLAETVRKKAEAYAAAMIQHRWGGKLPTGATRIEYRIYRELLVGYGLNTVERCLENLPSLIGKITRFDEHPFFVLTDQVPDRKGRHQDRVGVHLNWKQAIEIFQRQVGQPLVHLSRLDHGMMNAVRSVRTAISLIATAAARLECFVGSKDDLIAVFRELLDRNQISDDEIAVKWADKARRAGTFETVSKFPFGQNLAV